MIPLIKLKKDLQFNRELTFVVDVLRGIATARYFSLQKKLALSDEFAAACLALLEPLGVERLEHPFARAAAAPAAVLLVTSDGGFLGGLNHQVIGVGTREGRAGAVLSVVGERGAGILSDFQREFTSFPGIREAASQKLATSVRDHLVRSVLLGRCGSVKVVYPKPISFTVQRVTVETLLPCSAWVQPGRAVSDDTLWESDRESVMEYVAGQWMAHRLERLFAQSRLAELAARAIHLEGSYQELLQQGKTVRHQYFRARHELIDRSMREIFAAQLFCGKG